jgi:hemolysin activation/secretion protein
LTPHHPAQFVQATTLLAGLWLFLFGFESSSGAQSALNRTYQVNAYALRGNSALDEAAVGGVLTNATGPAVPLSRICHALAALRRAYQEHGYAQVRVSLPEQPLTNGIVVVDVTEGELSAENISVPAPTNAPAPMGFEVQRILVSGNTLLPPEAIAEAITNAGAIGPKVTLEHIRQAATNLRRAYHERGWVTVAVSLPAQRLTNATVRLNVTEGKLAEVQVAGNQYFSSANVLHAFPNLQTNALLNSHLFQRDLDAANQNRDRQVYPTLGPGPEAGTSALVLRVQDRLPLHAHLEMDNYNTPGTPDWRVNAAVQYNNLWQRDQQAGLAYSFSPQEFKTAGNTPDFGFNQPLISSSSAFYRIPLAASDTIGSQTASSSRFGYQEATRQFLLPPAQTESELVLYASASASDTGVKWGPPSTIANSNLTVVSRDSQQSVTKNANAGSQFRFPLLSGEHSRLTGFVGMDFKQAEMSGYSTNNFFYSEVITNLNLHSPTTISSNYSTGKSSASSTAVYFPVNFGAEYSATDPHGATMANLTFSGNFTRNDAEFAKSAYATNARAIFGKAVLTASREQKLPAGCSLQARASAQAATGALIGNEQFALGGINSVRGYYEGDEYGDCGWNGSVELRTPYWETRVANVSKFVPAWLRASVFTDCGESLLLEPASGAGPNLWLWGAGFGLSANVNNHVDARLTIAWPLLSTPNTERGEARANFSIGGQF